MDRGDNDIFSKSKIIFNTPICISCLYVMSSLSYDFEKELNFCSPQFAFLQTTSCRFLKRRLERPPRPVTSIPSE